MGDLLSALAGCTRGKEWPTKRTLIGYAPLLYVDHAAPNGKAQQTLYREQLVHVLEKRLEDTVHQAVSLSVQDLGMTEKVIQCAQDRTGNTNYPRSMTHGGPPFRACWLHARKGVAYKAHADWVCAVALR